MRPAKDTDGTSGDAGGSSSSKARTSQKQVEKIVLQYLQDKGYKEAEKALRNDAKLEGSESTLADLASGFPANEVGADASDAYNQSYGSLRRWIDSSLDVYKHELYAASYPVFVHAYLDLLMRGLGEKAQEFIDKYSGDHMNAEHVRSNELAKAYRDNKYMVRMTRVGFELLLSFLQDHQYTLLMRSLRGRLQTWASPGHTQNQIDAFNAQPVALGPAPIDPFVREQDEAATESAALLSEFGKIKQEGVAGAVPMPPARGRDRVALGPAALPSVCMYTLHNTGGTLNCTDAWTHEPLRRLKSSVYAPAVTSERDLEAAREPTGGESRRLVGHAGAVYGLDISFDNRYMISASEDRTARLWSLETLTNVVSYKGHNYPVWDASFAPQGFYFATASHDRTARLWSCDHIYALRIFAGHLSDVNCVRFHPKQQVRGHRIQRQVCASLGRAARQLRACLHLATRARSTLWPFRPTAASWRRLARTWTVNVWDLGSGRRMEQLAGHTGPEGTLLVSGGADETVRAWSINRSPDASDHPIVVHRREHPATSDKDAAAKKRDAAGLWKAKKVQESEALLATWRTKSTPIYDIMMTKRNLAVATGAFTL
ncbi:WD40 repeat-like protein [Linderina pennispora]|uniref:WD40 repeat-like protein n=1 Tax=Linderina pennispora TaxID=61395 RepID=A0A1Y1W119_9FUNG|nr:WD40 repeat-like protein [Linderina pennispora]ORX67172.1 WD40 repeat-like protein [Linderina pennispora]